MGMYQMNRRLPMKVPDSSQKNCAQEPASARQTEVSGQLRVANPLGGRLLAWPSAGMINGVDGDH
jgi:hypothetical protein